ncbi:hypothetical protein CRG98_037174 [Punica granatum]|uniref:Uncharacterized protein n=1 Tax=Punica granatum TaxID=22663 RepID=A0A2I0IF74_PUNGR|nr:hypothetical protein CRG98_037174 [Punica granatum]
MAEDQQPAIHEQDTLPMPTHSQTPLTQAIPLPIPTDISTAHSGVPSGHPSPTAQTASNLVDSAHFTALEGMVNQLVTNMATNMTELMAMLRDQNLASSSFTPPPEHRTTVDPNPVVPPIHVTDSEDISFSGMAHVPTIHPISDPLPLPPAPTAVPLPLAASLFADSAMHALPPLTMPMCPPIYTIPPPTAAPPAPLIDFFPETETEQERRMKKMEETIRALQAGNSRFDYSDSDWNLFPGMRLPPKIKIPDFKRYDGTRDPWHHLRHYQSKMLPYWDYEEFVIQTFQDSLTGSTLDWFMTLKAGNVPTWTNLSQKFLDQYQFCVETPPTLLDLSMTEMREAQQTYSPTIPTVIQSPPPQHCAPAQVQQSRIPASRSPQPTQRALAPQVQQGGVTQPRQRKQYTPLSTPPSHIFQQLLAGNKIKTEGAPGHTLDTCWRLQDKIQEMINTKQISFNEGKPPNVRMNPLLDHGSGSGPSANMISIATIGEDDNLQEILIPFIIDYPLAEIAFALAPFVIEVPTKEPYQDRRVPWDYGGEVANMEQEMSAMGITRSGRVYQGPEPADKGKAPTATFSVVPKVALLSTKKVTEQEAEAFMKVIKANEFRVVEQMGKSPAHILLLALLLSSELHRDALLKVLTAAQVPKDTAPNRIEETVSSIFSNQISFAEDELPSEGQGHLRALHIVCRCNNHVVGRVMIDNGYALNVCPVSTLKQMNVDMSHIHASKTTPPAREPWIHAAEAVPSSLHQKLKFFIEGKLITVNGEEDYAVYKETAVLYISIGEDQNLPFHSFDTISVIRDYGEVGPSQADRMIGKVLLKNDYVRGTGLGARGDSIFAPPVMRSCRLAVESISNVSLHIMGGTSDSPITESDDFSSDAVESFLVLPAIYAVTEETSSELQSNPNHRYNDSNSSETHLGKSLPVYFEEGLDEDGHVLEIEESLHRLENHQLTLVEPTEEIDIGTAKEPRTLRIRTGLQPAQRSRMIYFLTEYQEVFAWSYTDMPGLDPSIVKHFLSLDTERFPPKRQHLRCQRADLLLRIKEEVIKQVDAGFFEIQMVEKDKITTTIITMWGTFCYMIMHFGLKNAGATYQWAMVTLFHDMMHKEIEVYVDDIIAKSKEGEDHLVNLKRLFDHLKKYKLRLNPAKCTFGIKSGKLIGFVVNEKGIEVDPDNLKAIMKLPPPSTVHEVRSFLGRLNYIARFITNLTDKCQPLFHLLRKNAAFEWDDECQKDFDTVKAYLVQPPVLVPPSPDRPLIPYLTVRQQSIGCMLGQKDDSTHAERAIYYLSKKFTEGESNYLEIEKMCCALVWVMQRLRQYTLYHTVRLLLKTDPLKYLLGSPSFMRNIAKWRCQLTEYDIEYVSRTSVKGQAIADHLIEFSIDDDTPIDSDFPDEGILQVSDEDETLGWKMYFDGAVNSIGSGIGAVLISPEGRHFPVASKIDFPYTNNIAEYEACILGLQAAIDLKVKELEVFGDSMLTIFQTLKQWKMKDPKLVPYYEYLEELTENFENISFTCTPRMKNPFADALAMLSSMVSITKENLIEPLEFEIAKGPAHCDMIEAVHGKPCSLFPEW